MVSFHGNLRIGLGTQYCKKCICRPYRKTGAVVNGREKLACSCKLKEKLNRGGMCVGLLGRLKGMLWRKETRLKKNIPWSEDKDKINWTEGPERYHRNGVLVICRMLSVHELIIFFAMPVKEP